MSSLSQKLKKLMKIGEVEDSDDSTTYPILFVNFLGKLKSRAINFTPFGVWSRPPDGAMSLLFNVNGSESNKFAITNELKSRPVTDLAKGEVVLGNLLSYFHFKEDGSISLFVNGTETLTVDTTGNISITGDLTVTGTVQGSELTDGSVPYTTHVHAETGSTTGVPQ